MPLLQLRSHRSETSLTGVQRGLVKLVQPLVLSQVFSSAAGALAILLAAGWMNQSTFLNFALVNLIAVSVLGGARAYLFQPALIARRTDPRVVTPVGHAVSAAVGAGVIAAAASGFLVGWQAQSLLYLCIGCGVPVVHDWLRFRLIGEDRRWRVAMLDGLRLLSLVGAPFILNLEPTAAEFQGYLGIVLILPVLAMAPWSSRSRDTPPFASYRSQASLQLTDFAIGQFLTTIPMLALGVLGASPLLAGVRFAQTLLGPLNLAFAASKITLIADGATRQQFARDRNIVDAGRVLARRLLLLATGTVVVVVAVFWAAQLELSGVQNGPVVLGLLLVGALTLSSGWSGIYAIVLRILGHQAVVTIGRAVLTGLAVCGYLGGFLVGGVDGALVGGLLTAALVSPLVFALPARRVFRGLDQT